MVGDQPAGQVRRRFAGRASPTIDGRPCPDVDITVEWGDSPLFSLGSPGVHPGSVTWIVDDAEDAQVTAGAAGVTATLGPLDAPTMAPVWWGTVTTPMGAGVDLPHEARAGTAHMSVRGETLAGAVRLLGVGLDGGEICYEATITGRRVGADDPDDEGDPDDDADAGDDGGHAPMASTLGDRPTPAASVVRELASAPRGEDESHREGEPSGEGEPNGVPASSPIDRLMALDRRISANFADLPVLLGHLRDVIELRRELSVGPTATAAWSRLLADARASLSVDREVLACLAARGHLAGLIGAADSEIASAVARLECLDEASHDLAGLIDGVGVVAEVAAGLGARLHQLTGRALAADGHLLPPGDSRRADRERLLALLGAVPGSPEIDHVEIDHLDTGWERWIRRTLDEHEFAVAVKDVAVALTAAAARLARFGDHIHRLDPVGHARRTREHNGTAIARLTRYIELWRARMATDWDRILMMEQARPLYGRLVGALLDLGGVEDALAASEMARARAFADLVNGRRSAPVLTPARMSALLHEYGGPVAEYFLDGDRLIIFVARPDGTVEAADRPVDAGALLAWIDELHHDLRAEEVDGARSRELLRALGRVLWDPVARWLPGDPETPLTLVPHDQLLRVPFQALIGATGRHFVERHTATVLPAASILPRLMARRASAPPASSRICALVDPEPMPDGLVRLPTLRHRFGVISDLFADADVRLGPAATEAAMIEGAARRPSVLCLATHAEALPEDPMASFVALAGSKLSAGAVHELDLPVRLVVLAACETGAGRVTGDGVIGLSRAFLAAGPLAVLMTLWPVRERETLRVLRRFHDLQLNAGLGTARALRAAQCSMLAGHSPESWAAFTLFGLAD